MLQTFSIILTIIGGIIGIILSAIRAVRWAQNVDRQIRDLRLGLHSIAGALYTLMQALHSASQKLYDRISRGESVSINDLISSTITTLGEMSIRVVGEYLQLPLKESESLDPNGEARKRELLIKFQRGELSYGEALELQALLEEQRRRHEEAGNIIAAFLALTILLLLLAFLASLVIGERKEGGIRRELTKGI
jgi:hypothetical protein